MVVHNRYRSSSPSGEDRVVDQERAALEEAGHEVQGFERRSDDIASFPPLRKALVPAAVVWSSSPARDLEAVLATYRPDVVHIHNVFPLLSPSVLLACQRSGIPSVVTVHNFNLVCAAGNLFREGAICRDCVGRLVPTPGVAHGCYRDSSWSTVPRALSIVAHRKRWQTAPSAYIFLSEAQRLELEPAGLPVCRSFVKPNLVPPVRRRQTNEGLVVYLGRLAEEKGLRVLMDGWSSYTDAIPDGKLRLVIAGTGPLETPIRRWASSRPAVDVVGLLERSTCADLVARAAAVVVPSEWPEPFGLVVAEAMAAGVPPIATSHGAFRELITHGKDGILYPPSDPEALGRVLQRLDQNPGWTVELGHAAYDTYLRRFAPPGNIGELERIYRYAVSHPRQHGREQGERVSESPA